MRVLQFLLALHVAILFDFSSCQNTWVVPAPNSSPTYFIGDTEQLSWTTDYDLVELVLWNNYHDPTGNEAIIRLFNEQTNTGSYSFFVGTNIDLSQGNSFHLVLYHVDSSGNELGDSMSSPNFSIDPQQTQTVVQATTVPSVVIQPTTLVVQPTTVIEATTVVQSATIPTSQASSNSPGAAATSTTSIPSSTNPASSTIISQASLPSSISQNPSSTPSLSTSSIPSLSTSSNAPSASDNSGGGLSHAAVIGLGVGLGLGIPLLIIGAVIAVIMGRRGSSEKGERSAFGIHYGDEAMTH